MKTTKKSPSRRQAGTAFGMSFKTCLDQVQLVRGKRFESKTNSVRIYCFFDYEDADVAKTLKGELLPWQLQHLLKQDGEIASFAGKQQPIFVIRLKAEERENSKGLIEGELRKTQETRIRDLFGAVNSQLQSWKADHWQICFLGTSRDQERMALLGLELARYQFLKAQSASNAGQSNHPSIEVLSSGLTEDDLRQAREEAVSINLARHLVNLPPNELNPATFADWAQQHFKLVPEVAVRVLEGRNLEKDRCHLLMAVGAGAAHGPRLVHLRYRPKSGKGREPLALVGKGITFDSGGLDIKPSSGMRLMKKDMGGAAAAVAVFRWAVAMQIAQPLDVYLALAENSVDANSFHPSDVVVARNGLKIEIHNTDAEGRLALADAIDFAIDQDKANKPSALINIATLTGAIKVALGADVAGMFVNHDLLAERVQAAARETGDWVWRMPLHQAYKKQLKSHFADFANASDGFAGAITAALFLQQFVGKTPWAHLDIYAWKDSAGDVWSESGGSGQAVPLLMELIARWQPLRGSYQ